MQQQLLLVVLPPAACCCDDDNDYYLLLHPLVLALCPLSKPLPILLNVYRRRATVIRPVVEACASELRNGQGCNVGALK